MRGLGDYADYRERLAVDVSPGAWAAHYDETFLGSLSTPVISPEALYRLALPFGFSYQVSETCIVWEAAPIILGVNLFYDGGVRTISWQSMLTIGDRGRVGFDEIIHRPLGLPKVDELLGLLGQWRLEGNLYPFSEAVQAAIRF